MLYIILASVLYSIAIMLGAFASRKADPTLVAGITNLVSAILPFLILIKNFRAATEEPSKIGLLSAALTGGLISIFVIFLNRAYATEKIAIITPMVFGGSILFSSILSFFIYREKIDALQLLGLCLILIGIALIIISKLKS